MKIAYLDCASGISGDMLLGALVDSGVDLSELQAGLDSLGIPDLRLEATQVKRHAFRATKVHVHHSEQKAHRHLHHITDLIQRSRLTVKQQEIATKIFTRLGEAEAKVHGSTLQKVHFHEVGALDSIADILGVAIGLDALGVDQVICSPVPTGSGFIEIAHGRCSVPAPATAELLVGIPLAPSVVASELTTPTGAAIVATVVHAFGSLPPMIIERIGYGAGDRDFAEQANVLRLVIGQTAANATTDRVAVLEANLDQVTAEVIGYCSQRLLEAGALDVYTTAIQMKKQRPGTLLTILCAPADRTKLEQIVFQEARTLGVRHTLWDRTKLPREEASVATPWGNVTGKRITLPNGSQRFAPEYEDCRRLATEHQVALQAVLDAATRAPDAAGA